VTEISNTSSGYSTGGYGDFRAQAITGLYASQSFDIAVTCPQYGGSYYFWVDWDNDLSFDNTSGSTEYIGTIADALSGTITVTIPAGQAAGDYVLRTYLNNNQAAAADPCSSFTFGEYEDYTISVVETPSCTDVANLNSTGNTLTTVDLSWTETGTASLYNIEVYEDGADTTTATPIYTDAVNGATSTTVTGLTGHTFYDAYVQADCGFSGSSAFQSLRIYTGYCTPSTVTPGIVFINNLTTTGGTTNISNLASGYPSSSPTGFSDHRDQSISGLYGSQTFDITFEGGVYAANGTQYGGWWFIYVDWNNDLDFDPATELVYTSGANNNSNSTTITIPAGTAAGDYVIRVKVVQGDPGTETSSCADMSFGEVEDYTITVSETPSCVDVSNITVTSFTETTADLSWTENGAASNYNLELYPSGADQTTETPLQSETVTGATTASLTGLTPYTFYDVYIQTNCGFSGNAEFVSFTFRTGHCAPSSDNTIVYINSFTTTGGDTNISNTASGFSTGGYGDFRTQAITGLVQTQSFDVAVSSPQYGGSYHFWVDWNNDLAFDNTSGSSEFVGTIASVLSGTITVTIPAGQAAGDYVLRAVLNNATSADPDPCGDMLYGEVEDYTISVSEACSWNGATSTDWATGSNWSTGAAPTSSDTVLIKGTFTNEPSISSTDAVAKTVIVTTGNTLTIDETSSLTVSGDFTNTGTVTLNSTADDFSSLIVTGTATGDITYNRYVNVYDDTLGGGWDLVCSPVGMSIADFITANGSNIQVLGDDYAFSQFNNATGQWERYATASQTGNFEAGKGYSMATTGGSTVAFTGAMQTADQSINIINNNGLNGVGRRWNLVSNPFPSYILGNTAAGTNNFMDANSAVIDSEFLAVYGWNGSSYTIYNQLSGAFSMAPGQGFWVAALNTTDTALNFTAAMRTTTGTGDFVSSPQLLTYNVAVKLYNGEIEKAATDFYFRDGLSLDLDPGYDAAAFNQSMALSTRLPQGSQETAFGINAMGMDAMQNTRVPLEIRQNAGQAFRVSIADMELPEDIYVYLEDTLNGTLTSLKDGDFELVAQSNLSGSDRFFIVFKSNSVLSNGDTLGINALNVYKANTDSFVTIAGISPELGKLNVSLYNILGQTVREKALSSATATQRVSTQGLASGLYIVQIRSGNQTTVKKIIVK
ncbi:GEVED domain-containing protein, partial [bacterium]|nr:GEVED domain-containing protein [bacterium]